jgi:hypothetical protein
MEGRGKTTQHDEAQLSTVSLQQHSTALHGTSQHKQHSQAQ